MIFSSLESEAYELYHLLTNFVVKMEIRDPQVLFHFKALLNSKGVWGQDDLEIYNACNEFITKLESIKEDAP